MRRVVITGIGIVSPIGNNKDEFLNSLKSGKNGIDYITKFDTSEFKVKIAAEVKGFEPTDYMAKSEVRKNDLFTQYAIAAAQMAMEDCGDLDIDPKRLGVYVGSGVGGMNTFLEQAEKMFDKGPGKVSPFFVPMLISNIAAGQVAIKHNAKGVCVPIVTACATGTHSIGEAYDAIKFGKADAIISGGTEASVNSISVAGFTNCMALCTNNDIENASIPFDKRRSGFVMGEGAGIVILEEYERAKARGAHMYCEVVGYGNSCDAFHVTAPEPEATGAVDAIEKAVEGLDLQGKGIYFNAHGTSTPLNDKTETLAIKKAFGEDMARQMHISSTKSMTGHMLGATGAVEAIACALSIENDIAFPTINYKEKDEECDLNYTPNKAVETTIDIAISTSLGFGGHNACLAFKKI